MESKTSKTKYNIFKMIVIRVSRKFLFGYAGSCWFFVIFIAKDAGNPEATLRHEKVHFWQQLETMVIPFFLLYLAFYVIRRMRGFNHSEAYHGIPFELEAHEGSYKRKPYAWLKYC
jgi:hypothetical protein